MKIFQLKLKVINLKLGFNSVEIFYKKIVAQIGCVLCFAFITVMVDILAEEINLVGSLRGSSQTFLILSQLISLETITFDSKHKHITIEINSTRM